MKSTYNKALDQALRVISLHIVEGEKTAAQVTALRSVWFEIAGMKHGHTEAHANEARNI